MRVTAFLTYAVAVVCTGVVGVHTGSAQCCGGPSPIDLYADWPNEKRIEAWEHLIQPFEQAYVQLDDAVRAQNAGAVRSAAARLGAAWHPFYRVFGYFSPTRKRAETGLAQGQATQFAASLGDTTWSRLMDRMTGTVSGIEAVALSSSGSLPTDESMEDVRLLVVRLHEHEGRVTRSDRIAVVCFRIWRALPEDGDATSLLDPEDVAACAAELRALSMSSQQTEGQPAPHPDDAVSRHELLSALDRLSGRANDAPDLHAETVSQARRLAGELYVASGRRLTAGGNGAVAMVGGTESTTKETILDAKVKPGSPVPATPKIMVYYFHGTVRCETCIEIEAISQETVLETFADAIDSGRLEWRSVDYDKPENRHYEKAFELPCPSLVVAEKIGEGYSRWRILGKTWDLIPEGRPAVSAYVRREIEDFLK